MDDFSQLHMLASVQHDMIAEREVRIHELQNHMTHMNWQLAVLQHQIDLARAELAAANHATAALQGTVAQLTRKLTHLDPPDKYFVKAWNNVTMPPEPGRGGEVSVGLNVSTLRNKRQAIGRALVWFATQQLPHMIQLPRDWEISSISINMDTELPEGTHLRKFLLTMFRDEDGDWERSLLGEHVVGSPRPPGMSPELYAKCWQYHRDYYYVTDLDFKGMRRFNSGLPTMDELKEVRRKWHAGIEITKLYHEGKWVGVFLDMRTTLGKILALPENSNILEHSFARGLPILFKISIDGRPTTRHGHASIALTIKIVYRNVNHSPDSETTLLLIEQPESRDSVHKFVVPYIQALRELLQAPIEILHGPRAGQTIPCRLLNVNDQKMMVFLLRFSPANSQGFFCYDCFATKDIYRNRTNDLPRGGKAIFEKLRARGLVLEHEPRHDGRRSDGFVRRTKEIMAALKAILAAEHQGKADDRTGLMENEMSELWDFYFESCFMDLLHYTLRVGDCLFDTPLIQINELSDSRRALVLDNLMEAVHKAGMGDWKHWAASDKDGKSEPVRTTQPNAQQYSKILAHLDLGALYPPQAWGHGTAAKQELAEKVWLLSSRISAALHCNSDTHPYFISGEVLELLATVRLMLFMELHGDAAPNVYMHFAMEHLNAQIQEAASLGLTLRDLQNQGSERLNGQDQTATRQATAHGGGRKRDIASYTLLHRQVRFIEARLERIPEQMPHRRKRVDPAVPFPVPPPDESPPLRCGRLDFVEKELRAETLALFAMPLAALVACPCPKCRPHTAAAAAGPVAAAAAAGPAPSPVTAALAPALSPALSPFSLYLPPFP
eukprot:m.108248 g.108248  ORF g.108248 m.108248 type:complete len:838 (+) comp14274_c1_seq1:122-2635(+)